MFRRTIFGHKPEELMRAHRMSPRTLKNLSAIESYGIRYVAQLISHISVWTVFTHFALFLGAHETVCNSSLRWVLVDFQTLENVKSFAESENRRIMDRRKVFCRSAEGFCGKCSFAACTPHQPTADDSKIFHFNLCRLESLSYFHWTHLSQRNKN